MVPRLPGACLFLSAALAAGAAAQDISPIEREENVAAIAVKFADTAGAPYSLDDIGRSMRDAAVFIRQGSYGRVEIRTRAFGWLRMDVPESCDKAAVKRAANKAALGRVPLEEFSRIVFFAPRQSCDYDGFAKADREPVVVRERRFGPDRRRPLTVAWVNGLPTPRAIVHELGHSLGLLHAGSLECEDPPLGGACEEDEYDDPYDGMGADRAGDFNVYEKRRLGWLHDDELAAVPSSAGVYRFELTALERPGGLKGLVFRTLYAGRILEGYVEYREGSGAQFRLVVPHDPHESPLSETRLLHVTPDADALAAGGAVGFASPPLLFTVRSVSGGRLALEARVGRR